MSSVLDDDTEMIAVPKRFRIFQFYAPFSQNQLTTLGQPNDVWYKKHVTLDYDKIRKITSRVSGSENDGAKHPDSVNVEQMMSSEEEIYQISPFLNHSNPNSHIMIFNKEDLAKLLSGRTIYMATGFHQVRR